MKTNIFRRKMVKKRAIEELEKGIPKLFTYFLFLLITVFITYILLPIFGFLQSINIVSGLNLYQILNIFFPIIIIFIIFKIFKQLIPILDVFATQFVYTLPGLKKIEKTSVRRILSDFSYLIIVILIVTTLSPLASKLTHLGGIIINTISLVIILFLLYDVGKISYSLLERRIQVLNSKQKKSKQ